MICMSMEKNLDMSALKSGHNYWFLRNCSVFNLNALFSAAYFRIFPRISYSSFYERHCSFLVIMVTFLRLKLSCGTIIAANIGQAMVNLKLWLGKGRSLHREFHGGRGLNSQSLACESHTLPFGYHAT